MSIDRRELKLPAPWEPCRVSFSLKEGHYLSLADYIAVNTKSDFAAEQLLVAHFLHPKLKYPSSQVVISVGDNGFNQMIWGSLAQVGTCNPIRSDITDSLQRTLLIDQMLASGRSSSSINTGIAILAERTYDPSDKAGCISGSVLVKGSVDDLEVVTIKSNGPNRLASYTDLIGVPATNILTIEYQDCQELQVTLSVKGNPVNFTVNTPF